VREQRAERGDVCAVGADVVIDDVEVYREPDLVRVIDEHSKLIWRSIGPRRREQCSVVIAPVPSTRKVGDRHELNGRNSQIPEIFQPPAHAVVIAFRREGADMKLVKREPLPWDTGPAAVTPTVLRWIHDHRRSVYAFGLESGERVGKFLIFVDADTVARTGCCCAHEGLEIAVLRFLHSVNASALDHNIEPPGAGGPESKKHSAFLHQRSELHVTDVRPG